MFVYLRTPRAATPAAPDTEQQQHLPRQVPAATRQPVQTLWASHPLQVRAGRLVAVRLRGEELQVALVTGDGRRWARADEVLTAAQAERWVQRSRFVRHI
jgi:hypothetical protein